LKAVREALPKLHAIFAHSTEEVLTPQVLQQLGKDL